MILGIDRGHRQDEAGADVDVIAPFEGLDAIAARGVAQVDRHQRAGARVAVDVQDREAVEERSGGGRPLPVFDVRHRPPRAVRFQLVSVIDIAEQILRPRNIDVFRAVVALGADAASDRLRQLDLCDHLQFVGIEHHQFGR